MNSPADIDNDDADIEAQEQDDSAVDDNARFEGDTGTLPVPARRVLVRLLQGPSLDARRHEKLWNLLKRHELILRSRLHDLFLELVLDDQSRVAFARQVTSEEVDIPILLRRQSLSFIESGLLLFLKRRRSSGCCSDFPPRRNAMRYPHLCDCCSPSRKLKR